AQQRTRVQVLRRASDMLVHSTYKPPAPGPGALWSDSPMAAGTTRRELIRTGLAAGVTLAGVDWAAGLHRALAAPAACGRLADIEHVVIFVQENRSFDHYFGTYRGVRGFGDRSAAFAQPGYPAPGYGGHLLPFHLDSTKNGECTHDITHDWGPQHRAW